MERNIVVVVKLLLINLVMLGAKCSTTMRLDGTMEESLKPTIDGR